MGPQDNEAEDPPVLPALVPGQWARGRFGVETWGEVHVHSSGELTVRSIDQPVIFTAKGRHSLAALALHGLVVDGKPVGFTHEDVRNLRNILGAPAYSLALVQSLADRLAALLPPEAPDAQGKTLADLAREFMRGGARAAKGLMDADLEKTVVEEYAALPEGPPEAPVTLSDYARAHLQVLNAKVSDEVRAAYFGHDTPEAPDAQG